MFEEQIPKFLLLGESERREGVSEWKGPCSLEGHIAGGLAPQVCLPGASSPVRGLLSPSQVGDATD